MRFFDDIENVKNFIKSKDGYSGEKIISTLRKYLNDGKSVLELGMGAGKDLDEMKKYFKVTGTDYAKGFIDIYKENNKNADVFVLDAIKININKTYNCIYSNKVFQQMSKEEFKESLKNQMDVLKDDGILFHMLWYGRGQWNFNNIRIIHYTEDELRELVGDMYEIIDIKRYNEDNSNNYIYMVLKKKNYCKSY